MPYMNKYIGKYRVFGEINIDTGKSSDNPDDTYLLCKNNIQVYRHYGDTDSEKEIKNKLAILFPTTSSRNKILPLLKKSNIQLELYFDGEIESIYTFSEKDSDIVFGILKPQVKGKDVKPDSVVTVRKLIKYYAKEDKEDKDAELVVNS